MVGFENCPEAHFFGIFSDPEVLGGRGPGEIFFHFFSLFRAPGPGGVFFRETGVFRPENGPGTEKRGEIFTVFPRTFGDKRPTCYLFQIPLPKK